MFCNFTLALVFIFFIRYIINMNLRWCFIFGLVLAGGRGGPLLRADVAPAANPYSPIVQRNIFGLVPIPVHTPADDVVVTPPPKITPNGIMRLFGNLQVIFKVAMPGKAGQPPKDESFVLGEGDRQDDIVVQKIDEASATITFNNHGTIQSLPLVASTAAPGGGPAPGVPGMAPPPGMSLPGVAPALGANAATIGFGGRFGRNRNVPASAPSPSPTGPASPNASIFNAEKSDAEGLTPEQQVILIEAQRQQYMQKGDPMANLMPETPLTQQVKAENGVPTPAPGD